MGSNELDEGISLPRVLVVDDDRRLLETTARILGDAACAVSTAANGREAVALLAQQTFEAILSDINMPEMNGIELLRAVRERDRDVPVLLMTVAPDLSTAMEAVALGAHQYLLKPFDLKELRTALARAVRLCRMARLKKEALLLVSEGGLGSSDRAGLESAFRHAVDTLWMAYQPLVRAIDQTLFGYEALVRCQERALSTPLAMLDAADRLGRLPELGERIREAAVAPISRAPQDALLFINLHAADLNDSNLASVNSHLGRIADRVVFEITERASLDRVEDVRARVADLRRAGFRIAIDDLGAGYAGLTSFAVMEPQFVKFDGSLVRGIDHSPTKQRLVRSMNSLCNDLSIITVAEGIETVMERDTLIELGCDLLQGYLFARPDKPFPRIRW